MFRKSEVNLDKIADPEHVAGWLSDTLSTITSNVFTKLTVCIIAMPFSTRAAIENSGGSVDPVLDRFSLCEDVSLVMRMQGRMEEEESKGLAEKCFPLMWRSVKIVIEVPDRSVEDAIPRRIRHGGFP